MPDKPSPSVVGSFLERFELLKNLANQHLVSIYYLDESGFSLQPNIPYAWQPIGEQWSIPSRKNFVAGYMSLLNVETDHLVTYKIPKNETMNSSVFIQFMDDFASKIVQETVVILDNASYHKSALTKSKFDKWREQGLHLMFLPPYSPHLNKVETLWRKIKNEWLKIRDYRSEKTLEKKLIEIFKKYGLDFNIEFSMSYS